jgi:hypothetical protein
MYRMFLGAVFLGIGGAVRMEIGRLDMGTEYRGKRRDDLFGSSGGKPRSVLVRELTTSFLLI